MSSANDCGSAPRPGTKPGPARSRHGSLSPRTGTCTQTGTASGTAGGGAEAPRQESARRSRGRRQAHTPGSRWPAVPGSARRPATSRSAQETPAGLGCCHNAQAGAGSWSRSPQAEAPRQESAERPRRRPEAPLHACGQTLLETTGPLSRFARRPVALRATRPRECQAECRLRSLAGSVDTGHARLAVYLAALEAPEAGSTPPRRPRGRAAQGTPAARALRAAISVAASRAQQACQSTAASAPPTEPQHAGPDGGPGPG